MNVAYTASGKFVEIQASAENGLGFDRGRMNEMVDMATAGCLEMMEHQRRAFEKLHAHRAVVPNVDGAENREIQSVGAIVAENNHACWGEMLRDNIFGERPQIGGTLGQESVGGIEKQDVRTLGGSVGGGEPGEEIAAQLPWRGFRVLKL